MYSNQAIRSEKSEGYFSYFFSWIPFVVISPAQHKTYVSFETTVVKLLEDVDGLKNDLKKCQLDNAEKSKHFEATFALLMENQAEITKSFAVIKQRDATIKELEVDIEERDATIKERDATIAKLNDDLKESKLRIEHLEKLVKNNGSIMSHSNQDVKEISRKEGDSLDVVTEVVSCNQQLEENELVYGEMHALSMGELLERSGFHSTEVAALKRENEILAKRNTYLERYLSLPIKENQLLNELACNPSGLADDILLNIFSMNEKAAEGKIVNIGDELLQLHKAIHKISQTHRDIEGEYALILNRILNATVSVDDNMRRTQRKLRPEEFRHFRSSIEEMIGKYMDLKREYNDTVACR